MVWNKSDLRITSDQPNPKYAHLYICICAISPSNTLLTQAENNNGPRINFLCAIWILDLVPLKKQLNSSKPAKSLEVKLMIKKKGNLISNHLLNGSEQWLLQSYNKWDNEHNRIITLTLVCSWAVFHIVLYCIMSFQYNTYSPKFLGGQSSCWKEAWMFSTR